jgi:hypothetical protein
MVGRRWCVRGYFVRTLKFIQGSGSKMKVKEFVTIHEFNPTGY